MSIKDEIKFNADGLIPAVVQDFRTNEVLMLAYMNEESLEKTLAEGKACYYSRSRQKLWVKGETSGHYQLVKDILVDCDADTLLLKVEQIEGTACHTGERTCFHRELKKDGSLEKNSEGTLNTVEKLYNLIQDRKVNPPEGRSYTAYLFREGQDKILKKVGEESAEVIIASKNNSADEIIYEASDLVFHLLVLLNYHGLTMSDIYAELEKRRK